MQRASWPSLKEPAKPSTAVPGATAPAASERGKAPAAGALSNAIQRLEEIVDQETAALRSRAKVDLKDFNDRKNHALLELSRTIRHLKTGGEDQALLDQLSGLRAKLEINRTVLKMHLDAVREVSTTLSDAIRNADSDGTYSHVLRTGVKQ